MTQFELVREDTAVNVDEGKVTMDNKIMNFRPVRCSRCSRFLLEEAIVIGRVRVKCRKCKTLNIIEINPCTNDYECTIIEDEGKGH